ncbi:MAG: polysaccharide biosynthesis/export family protein [Sulfuricaulis sp.]|uniref:polysaccharide biosynthesis/export family protein n=1 Tax=Sulfuricaulis sp. TaxID=2003553 RepID=UPI0025CD11B1|nr:polysaccharide biosynthesis/export family protein [Sulfuricaulis sp.]MCR4347296.1 polysaccharide biosynthesis/export family protein [Sulfuricaulis sp.]
MQRLKKLFQSILIVAVLASCGTTPPAVAESDANDAKTSAPEAATADMKDTATVPVSNTGTTPVNEEKVAAPRDVYIIQPGDILAISVWKEKDLQGEFAVRPDGGINFPLAGDIVVAGKTIEQIQVDIAAKLIKYVPDSVVTASVKQSQGNKIYVVGKVNKPGEFVSNRTIDVMQALSMAGGPNPYASVNKIKIIRRVNGEQKIFYFKYSRVEKGEDLEQNIILQGGDIVVVP